MQEINLLQSRIKDTTYSWEKQSKIGLAILAGILILILGASAVFYFLTQSLDKQNSALTAANAKLQSELTQKSANLGNAKVFQAQLSNMKALLARHIYFSPFFDEIEKMTYQKAQYISLDADQDTGQVHLEGLVANYTDLGKLLLGLSTSGSFSNVKLLSAAPSSGAINAFTFSIDLTARNSIFNKK